MTALRQVEVFPVDVPITRDSTFGSANAGAAGQKAVHVFVNITDASGEIGWVECRPMPTRSDETAHSGAVHPDEVEVRALALPGFAVA
ncbi:MAG: hypothetical protein ABI222_16415 [Opitutaceae bacterium]